MNNIEAEKANKEGRVAKAMEELNRCIEKATPTWEGVDVDRYLDEVRGVDVDLIDAAAALVEAVEQYVEPKPGTPYMHRSSLLAIKNRLKEFVI